MITNHSIHEWAPRTGEFRNGVRKKDEDQKIVYLEDENDKRNLPEGRWEDLKIEERIETEKEMIDSLSAPSPRF